VSSPLGLETRATLGRVPAGELSVGQSGQKNSILPNVIDLHSCCNASLHAPDIRRADFEATMINSIPFRERVACTVEDAQAATGISRRKLFELMPEIETRKVGRRRLILVRSLIERLEGPATGEATA
jgi:hypothetical protein